MNRIAEAFNAANSRGRGALVIYLTAGFPNLDESEALMLAAAESGADIIEVGVPFSDPIADGPTIQAASQQALEAGTNLKSILCMISRLNSRVATPLVIMSCYNPILAYGPERFAEDAAEAGACGVLIADMPPGESGQWCDIAADNGLATVFLVAPTTRPERFDQIMQRTTGFVYVLSRQGVTGERASLPQELPELVARVRQHSRSPVAVGFGISNAEQVATVCAAADGAIVGSAVVRAIAEQDSATCRLRAVRSTVTALAAGCCR